MHLQEGEECLVTRKLICHKKVIDELFSDGNLHLQNGVSNDNVVDAVFVVHCCVHRDLQPVENEGAQAKD